MSSRAGPSSEAVEVATLLGRRDLKHALVCLRTFSIATMGMCRFRVHDDGTLSDSDIATLEAALPVSRVVRRVDADGRARLELAGRPASRALRDRNPLALKLFDIAWFEESQVLRYVDSDVLFLRSVGPLPVIGGYRRSVFYPDRQSAYSLRPWQVLGRWSGRLPARINSGLFLAERSLVDQDRLESFLATWSGFAPEWIEQTCWAVLAGVAGTTVLDPHHFAIHDPGRPVPADMVALHFVSSVRSDLFRVVDRLEATEPGGLAEVKTLPAATYGFLAALTESLQRRLRR